MSVVEANGVGYCSASSINWNRLDSKRFVLNGSFYIFLSDFALYPADLLTTKLQVDRNNILKQVTLTRWIREILRREGVIGVYKGFSPTLLSSFPGQLSYYMTYEWTKQKLLNFSKQGTVANLTASCGAGFLAEAISGLVYVPTDILTQKLQLQQKMNFLDKRYQYKSSFDVLRKTLRTEGLFGLYRGFGAYLAVYGPHSAVWWLVYEGCKRGFVSSPPSIASNESNSCYFKRHLGHVISGGIAGALAVVATNPLDVAKTRFQTLEISNSLQKKQIDAGFMSILKRIYQKEGFSGLYRGMKPRIYLKIPGSAIAFVGYEILKEKSMISDSA